MENHPTVFHRSCISLHSHYQRTRIIIFPHSCQHFAIFDPSSSHPNGSEVVSYCGFDLHSHSGYWYWAFFHMLIVSLLWRCLFKSFAQFSIELLVYSCGVSLYILDINPLSDISFANIFSHSIIAFPLCYCVLWCTKFFNFDEVQFI